MWGVTHYSDIPSGWIEESKEGNALFNDALNTFYLWLYGVRHMAKDHSDSKRENLVPLHGLLFPINSNNQQLYAPSHRQDSTYHSLCYTSCGELTRMINSSMGPRGWIDLVTHHTMGGHSTM